MGFLLILGVIVLVVGLVMRYSERTRKGDHRNRWVGAIGIILGIVIILGGIIASSFTTVPAGHRGVIIRFGAVTGRVLDEGLQTKVPFFDSVVKMSVQTQKYEADATSAPETCRMSILLLPSIGTLILLWPLMSIKIPAWTLSKG